MTKIIFIGTIFISQFVFSQRLVNYAECNSLKTQKEKEVSYASEGGGGGSWCSIPSQSRTAYVICMCQKEKEELRIIAERQEAKDQLLICIEYNREIYKNAMLEKNEADALAVAIISNEVASEYDFNIKKNAALSLYRSALTTLDSRNSCTELCMRVDPSRNKAECDDPYLEDYNMLELSKKELERKTYTPIAQITVNDGASYNNATNSEKSEENTIALQGNESQSSSSKIQDWERDAIERNGKAQTEIENAKSRGDYLEALRISNENPNLLSADDSYLLAKQAGVQLGIEILYDLFTTSEAERIRYYNEMQGIKNNRKLLENRLAQQEGVTANKYTVKRNENDFFGLQNESGEWVVKPKYLEMTITNTEGNYITLKVLKKNFSYDTLIISKQ